MENQIVEAILSLLGVVLTGIVGFVGKELVKYIRTNHKEKLASMAVQFVEETYKNLGGAKKFEKAAQWLVDKLESVGIKNITDTDVEALVQSAVKKMKSEVSQAVAPVVDPVEVTPAPVAPVTPTPVPAPVINPDQTLNTLKVSDLQHIVNSAVKAQ